jgi:voltage-gated potassium channel
MDKIAVTVFIVDYLLRWATADFKLKRKFIWAFLEYPFTPMAVVDLLSILPSLTLLNAGFKALRVLRLIRSFRVVRVVRVFKLLRYSRSMRIIFNVLNKSKEALGAVFALAFGYILVSAMVILNVEPESFDTFYDAVYWATISLTTMGYGDIYPVTPVGRFVTMLSSFIGIAIVALPSGIITAGYMRELEEADKEKQ